MLFDVSEITTKPKVPEVKKQIKQKIEDIDFSKRISLVRHFDDIAGYDDFTIEEYPNGFVFFDFEVFKFDWMVVLIDPINKTIDIIVNDARALFRYYHNHSSMIWTGFNNKHYDNYIIKGILSGVNPKEISDYIIEYKMNPFEKWGDKFKRFNFVTYDVADCFSERESLKLLEAYMGDDIEETSVPFDIQRLLVMDEIESTIFYCTHDVEETIEVFRRIKPSFDGSKAIIDMFDFPISAISKTHGQLTAMVTNCESNTYDDEFDVTFVPTIKLSKYAYVMDWFKEILKTHSYKTPIEKTEKTKHIFENGKQVYDTSDSNVSYVTNVCGVPHIFAWGGLHGAPDEPIHITGKMYHADVTSYYPSLMLKYGFFTRSSKNPEQFKNVYDMRVALKKAGKKKEQAPLKIILNSQYGITKFIYSPAYDPVQANNICINGQLLLLDLLEKLEFRLGDKFKLLQSNTDGIIFMIPENDERSERIAKHIIDEWCKRTGLGMGLDFLTKLVQKDVNNYIFVFYNSMNDKLLEKIRVEFPEARFENGEIVLK